VLACGPAWAAFGDTDTTFGGPGVPGFAIRDLGGDADRGIDLVTGAHDRLYALGLSCNAANCPASNKLVVTRYDADGHVDGTFGSNGDLMVATNVSSTDYRLEVDDAQSNLYLSTVLCNATNCVIAVVRRNLNGTPDTTYGNNAIATFGTPTNHPAVLQLLLQDDGKLLVLLLHATLDSSNQPTAIRYDVVRLNANGTLDTSWGSGGSAQVGTAGGCDQDVHLAAGPNPELYVTGAKGTTCAGPYVPVVRRFTANGSPDAGFGTSGEVAGALGQTGDDVAFVAQEHANGKIGYGIGTFDGANGFTMDVVQLNHDGTLDGGFTAEHGSYTPISSFVPFGNNVFQSTGKMVINGQFKAAGSSNANEGLTRLLGSGQFAHPQRPEPGSGPPAVGFLEASTTVSEDAGNVTVTVTLSHATDHDVTVPFTLGGNATRGVDYNVSSNAFVIPAGATSGTVVVSIIDDNVEEFGESILFDLDAPDGALPTSNHNTFIIDVEDNDLTNKPVNVPDAGGALPLELLIGLLGLAGLKRAALRRR